MFTPSYPVIRHAPSSFHQGGYNGGQPAVIQEPSCPMPTQHYYNGPVQEGFASVPLQHYYNGPVQEAFASRPIRHNTSIHTEELSASRPTQYNTNGYVEEVSASRPARHNMNGHVREVSLIHPGPKSTHLQRALAGHHLVSRNGMTPTLPSQACTPPKETSSTPLTHHDTASSSNGLNELVPATQSSQRSLHFGPPHRTFTCVIKRVELLTRDEIHAIQSSPRLYDAPPGSKYVNGRAGTLPRNTCTQDHPITAREIGIIRSSTIMRESYAGDKDYHGGAVYPCENKEAHVAPKNGGNTTTPAVCFACWIACYNHIKDTNDYLLDHTFYPLCKACGDNALQNPNKFEGCDCGAGWLCPACYHADLTLANTKSHAEFHKRTNGTSVNCRCGKDLRSPEAKAEVTVLQCAGCMGLSRRQWHDMKEFRLFRRIKLEQIKKRCNNSTGAGPLRSERPQEEPLAPVLPDQTEDMFDIDEDNISIMQDEEQLEEELSAPVLPDQTENMFNIDEDKTSMMQDEEQPEEEHSAPVLPDHTENPFDDIDEDYTSMMEDEDGFFGVAYESIIAAKQAEETWRIPL